MPKGTCQHPLAPAETRDDANPHLAVAHTCGQGRAAERHQAGDVRGCCCCPVRHTQPLQHTPALLPRAFVLIRAAFSQQRIPALLHHGSRE